MHRSEKPIPTSSSEWQRANHPPPPAQHYRVAIRFSIAGDLRFISHRDTVRLWTRALRRSQLPLRYSQGMNPRPKLSLPVPRPVGVASEDEWLLAELSAPIPPMELCQRLAEQVPAGLAVLAAQELRPTERWVPTGAVYRLGLPEAAGQGTDWESRIQQCLKSDHLPVRRESDRGRNVKTLDIRPLIGRLRMRGDYLEMELNICPQGSAKPAEVLQAVGLEPREHLHRLVRQQILWAKAGSPNG